MKNFKEETQFIEHTLQRDKDGFLLGDVSDLAQYLPFKIHDADDDTWAVVDDDNFIDWSGDIDLHPRYDKFWRILSHDEKCERYKRLHDGWDKLSLEEKRERINNFRCGF